MVRFHAESQRRCFTLLFLSQFSKVPAVYLCKYTILLRRLDKRLFVFYYMYTFEYKRRPSVFPTTVYLKGHKRKPVRFCAPLAYRDLQADLPRGWCSQCGGEVFRSGQDLCVHCAKGDH